MAPDLNGMPTEWGETRPREGQPGSASAAADYVLAAVANGSTEQGKAESTQETLERARERGEKELKALEEVVKRGRSEKDKLASRWRSIEDWASRDSADAVNGQKDGNENASIDWNSGFPEGIGEHCLCCAYARSRSGEETEVERLQRRCQELEKECNNAKGREENLKEELRRTKESESEARSGLEKLRERLGSLEQESKDISKVYEQLREAREKAKEREEAMQQYKDEALGMKEQCASLEKHVADLQEEVTKASEERDRESKRASVLQMELSELKGKGIDNGHEAHCNPGDLPAMDSQKANSNSLTGRSHALLKSTCDALGLHGADDDIEQMSTWINGDVHEMRTMLQTGGYGGERLLDQFSAMFKSVKKHKELLQEAVAEACVASEVNKDSVDEMVSCLRSELLECKAKLAEASDLQERVDSLEKELTSREEEHDHASKDATAAKDQLEELRQFLEDVRAERDNLKNHLDNAREQNKQHLRRIEELEGDNEVKKCRIQELQSSLSFHRTDVGTKDVETTGCQVDHASDEVHDLQKELLLERGEKWHGGSLCTRDMKDVLEERVEHLMHYAPNALETSVEYLVQSEGLAVAAGVLALVVQKTRYENNEGDFKERASAKYNEAISLSMVCDVANEALTSLGITTNGVGMPEDFESPCTACTSLVHQFGQIVSDNVKANFETQQVTLAISIESESRADIDAERRARQEAEARASQLEDQQAELEELLERAEQAEERLLHDQQAENNNDDAADEASCSVQVKELKDKLMQLEDDLSALRQENRNKERALQREQEHREEVERRLYEYENKLNWFGVSDGISEKEPTDITGVVENGSDDLQRRFVKLQKHCEMKENELEDEASSRLYAEEKLRNLDDLARQLETSLSALVSLGYTHEDESNDTGDDGTSAILRCCLTGVNNLGCNGTQERQKDDANAQTEESVMGEAEMEEERDMRRKLQARVQELSDKLNDLTEGMEGSEDEEEKGTTLHAKLLSVQEEKETLQSKLEIAHEELEKANQQSDVDEAVKEMQSKLNQKDETVRALQEHLDSAQNSAHRAAEASAASEVKTVDVTMTPGDLSSVEKVISEWREHCRAKDVEINRLKEKVVELRDELRAQAEDSEEQLDAEYRKNRQVVEELQKSLETAEQTAKASADEAARLREEMAQYSSSYNHLQASLEAAQEEEKAAQEREKAQRERMEDLKAQLQSKQRQVTEAENDAERAKMEMEDRSRRLEQVASTLAGSIETASGETWGSGDDDVTQMAQRAADLIDRQRREVEAIQDRLQAPEYDAGPDAGPGWDKCVELKQREREVRELRHMLKAWDDMRVRKDSQIGHLMEQCRRLEQEAREKGMTIQRLREKGSHSLPSPSQQSQGSAPHQNAAGEQ